MHPGDRELLTELSCTYPNHFVSSRVLELGSLNISGTARDYFDDKVEYVGIDIVAGPDVDSFSTWRIWQTLGSSACLVGEKGDSWPFVAGDHFVGLPTIDWVNVEGVAVDLKRILGDTDLLGVARRAHEEVAHAYTCRRCLDDYLVPAGGEICGS